MSMINIIYSVRIEELYMLQAETNNCQHSRCSNGRMSLKEIREKSKVHLSAVKLAKDDIIFRGINPITPECKHWSILSCIKPKSFCQQIYPFCLHDTFHTS